MTDPKLAEYGRRIDAITRERDQWRTAADNALAQVNELATQRDEYRQQDDNLRADNLRQAERIATLMADLAKMPRTPDGVLVVLGETTLYTRYSDCICHGVPLAIKHRRNGVGKASTVLVEPRWWYGEGLQFCRWSAPLEDCYGSDANLLKAGK